MILLLMHNIWKISEEGTMYHVRYPDATDVTPVQGNILTTLRKIKQSEIDVTTIFPITTTERCTIIIYRLVQIL